MQREPVWMIHRLNFDTSDFLKNIYAKFPFLMTLNRIWIFWMLEGLAFFSSRKGILNQVNRFGMEMAMRWRGS